MNRYPQSVLLSLAAFSCIACLGTPSHLYSPQDELRAGLSTLPRRGASAVTLSPEESGATTLPVTRELWPSLFTLLNTLTPAPYLTDSECQFLGAIEISGPMRKHAATTFTYPLPDFRYTITLRRHTPSGRCIILVGGSEEHASFPYAGDSILEWYNNAFRGGA